MSIEIINANGNCTNLPYTNIISIKKIKKEIEQNHGKTYNSLYIYSDEKQLRDYHKINQPSKLYCIIYENIKIQIDTNVFNLSVNITFYQLNHFIANHFNKLNKTTNDKISFIITCDNIKLNKSNYIYYLKDNKGYVIKQLLNSYYSYWNPYNTVKKNKSNIICKYNFSEINYNSLVFDTIVEQNYDDLRHYKIDHSYYNIYIDIYYLHNLNNIKHEQLWENAPKIISNSDTNIITYCIFNLEDIKINSYDLSFSTYYVNIKNNTKIYNSIKLFEYYILLYLYDYLNKYSKKFSFNELENNKISNIIDIENNDQCKLNIKINLLDKINDNLKLMQKLNDHEYTLFIMPRVSIIKFKYKSVIKIYITWSIGDIEFN